MLTDTVAAPRLRAEMIGTFALVFAGAGAVMVDAKTDALGHVGVAITFGLVIMVMIYGVGHISGAHFNPAVSFAFALTRHFPWTRVRATGSRRLSGALLAAALLRASLGNARTRRRDAARRLEGAVVPLGSRPDLVPDVRDHGRRNRHARSRRGRSDRGRRHGRARRDVRRADLGRVDESRALARPRDRQRRPARALDLPVAPIVGAAIGAVAYQFVGRTATSR